MTNRANVNEMGFGQLFKQIPPEEICAHISPLGGKDLPVITAGRPDHYNSMTGSGGGFGLLFKKPTTWCILRADRYTLEIMQQEQAYTLSYFSDEHKEQMLFLGSKSGRDSTKMNEVELTGVQTPAGAMSFKEARLIIACNLTALMTAQPADFCTQAATDYLNEAYKERSDYRKFVFGEITRVWVKK